VLLIVGGLDVQGAEKPREVIIIYCTSSAVHGSTVFTLWQLY
jgi:hypothetical protein